jgi:hypothetical protein
VETQFEMSKFRKITKKHKLQKFGGNPISIVKILRKLQRTWAKYKNWWKPNLKCQNFKKITKNLGKIQKIGGNPI